MISDEELEGLPDDPEQAFVELERIASERLSALQMDRGRSYNDAETWDDELDYMNVVLASAKALGIEAFNSWSVPAPDDSVYSSYHAFRLFVKNYTMQLRVAKTRRRKASAIAFDPKAKSKLRHLIEQMRKAVDEAELTPRKKDAFYVRIGDLAMEVDRTWTTSESLGNLIIELAGDVGEGFEKLEPIRKWVDSIAAVFGKARRDQQDALPPPSKQKQIEGPKGAQSLTQILEGSDEE